MTETERELVLDFPLGKIDFDDERFMQRTDKAKWEEQVKRIMESIRKEGQRDPVSIGKLVGEDSWIRLAGFTRTEALRRLGRDTCKAYLYEDITEKEARTVNVTDNTMRYDLDPMDKAEAMAELKEMGVPVDSQDEKCITFAFDMSKAEVYRWLKVVREGKPKIKQAIRDGLPLTHAIEMIDHSEEVDKELIDKDLNNNWTMRDLETEMDLGNPTEEVDNDLEINYDALDSDRRQFITMLSQVDFDEMSESDFQELRELLKDSLTLMRKYL